MNKCPVCNKLISQSNQSASIPFCSERCRLIDLGDWLSESHKIPAEENDQVTDEFRQIKTTKH